MIQSPSDEGFTVYTKTDCKYCAMVKELLEDEIVTYILCDEYLAEDKDRFLAFIDSKGGKEHKTFPMVFFDAKFVGGFTDTLTLMKRKYD